MSNDAVQEERILSAADIDAADDLSFSAIKIYVKEWGGTVLFRPMTGEEAQKYFEQLNSGKKTDGWLRLFSQCAVDAEGKRLFSPAQIDRLRKKSLTVFLRLQQRLMHLNGMGRGEKTWEALLPMLQEAGVEQDVIDKVEKAWISPEDEAKND